VIEIQREEKKMKQWVDGKGYVNMSELAKEHTAGKWKMDEHGCLMAGSEQIAAIYPKDRKANGALIEAAPELYEALKMLILDFNEGTDPNTLDACILTAQTLLSKLEGAE
jgi:hypothetical protein